MKILIVNTNDTGGGAARAAYRLHQALLQSGIRSQMLVQHKLSDDHTVIGPESGSQKVLVKLRPTLDNLPLQKYAARNKAPFSPAWLPFSGIAKRINSLHPDIVHLHWIGAGMLRIEELASINVPIVWSLHDDWAFTGGCHIKRDCMKYNHGCGACPILGSNRVNDISRKIWNRKKKTYSKLPDMVIIGLSTWLADCAKNSSLLHDHEVVNLPNPIDINKYKPYSKQQARELLNLPIDQQLIMFGAMSATSDTNKGFSGLKQALAFMENNKAELVVFGSSQPSGSQGFRHKVHYLGQLNDDLSLRVLYSAADVVVVPSLQENLSNVIMESLACGTPVVCFNTGGNSDMVVHKKNGYLAMPFEPDDLSAGINWVLDHENPRALSINARNTVLEKFDSSLVAQKYIDLYKQILHQSKHA